MIILVLVGIITVTVTKVDAIGYLVLMTMMCIPQVLGSSTAQVIILSTNIILKNVPRGINLELYQMAHK